MTETSNHQHPRVEVDLSRFVLIVNGPAPYEIDLERCQDPAHLMHSLLNVSRKPWCDRALAGEILSALETACWSEFRQHAERVYCPNGQPNYVDWDGAEASPVAAT